ncbi:hypothetical protein ABPG72_009524 [Tetrahymena utriculariae]
MTDILDIKYQELIEWLKSRNQIPKEWTKQLKAVQLKMKELIDKADQIQDKKIVSYIKENKEEFSYYHLEKVITMLLQTPEAQQKSFFGGYTNQVIKDWIAIEKFYKKENIHLISLAKLLIQNVQYEIPGFTKNVSMLENQIKYSSQKKQDFENTIKKQQAEYESQCAKLGIEGKNLDQEIAALASKLPEHFQKVEDAAKTELIQKGLTYYYQFTMYVNSKSTKDSIKLSLLDELIFHGDEPVSVYEKRKGGKEITAEDENLIKIKYDWYHKFKQNKKDEDQIDWNIDITDVANTQEQAGGICWDVEDNTNKESEGINWDFGTTAPSQPAENQTAEVVEINWDISDINTIQQSANVNLNTEDLTSKNFQEIETILSNRNYRNSIISNISELIQFLNQRYLESKQYSANSILQTYETTQEGLLDIKPEEIKQIKDSFERLLNHITNFQFRQLLLFKEQQKSCDRIIAQLNSYKENIKRYEQNIKNMIKKELENVEQVKEYSSNKQKKVVQALELKDAVEKKLTEAIKRKCVLVGDINKLKK